MKKGATRKFTINVDSAIINNLNNVLDMVAHVKVNKKIILKYKKGGGEGYTAITIDGTTLTRAYVYIDRDQSNTLPIGQMTLETIIRITDSAYGVKGKTIVSEIIIDTVEPSSTTVE